MKSRNARSEVMTAFWNVCRKDLRLNEETEKINDLWRTGRFSDENGGFSAENYHDVNTCSFWSIAGCHAPNLRQVAQCVWRRYRALPAKLNASGLKSRSMRQKFATSSQGMCYKNSSLSADSFDWNKTCATMGPQRSLMNGLPIWSKKWGVNPPPPLSHQVMWAMTVILPGVPR